MNFDNTKQDGNNIKLEDDLVKNIYWNQFASMQVCWHIYQMS